MIRDEILQATIRQYLESADFNGWSISRLKTPAEADAIITLIEDGLIDHLTQEDDENIHIKRLRPQSPAS